MIYTFLTRSRIVLRHCLEVKPKPQASKEWIPTDFETKYFRFQVVSFQAGPGWQTTYTNLATKALWRLHIHTRFLQTMARLTILFGQIASDIKQSQFPFPNFGKRIAADKILVRFRAHIQHRYIGLKYFVNIAWPTGSCTIFILCVDWGFPFLKSHITYWLKQWAAFWPLTCFPRNCDVRP